MTASFFDRLKTGLEEGIAHAEGRAELRSTVVSLPSPPPPIRPRQIIALRRRLNLSQVAFARLLNVSPATLRRWEQGEAQPTRASLRLLQLATERPEVLFDVAGTASP